MPRWMGLMPRRAPAGPQSAPPSREKQWRRHCVKILGRRQALKFIKSDRKALKAANADN